MAIEVVPLTEADIPDAIEIIQSAFAEDPYFKWVFDAANVSFHSLTLMRKGSSIHSPTEDDLWK